MKTISRFVFVLALGLGAGVALGNGPFRVSRDKNSAMMQPDQASNAAFRDGLYQAKLAVERGGEARMPFGRWGASEDRASFVAGYQRGLELASTKRHVEKSGPGA